jgi:hypothetical protein
MNPVSSVRTNLPLQVLFGPLVENAVNAAGGLPSIAYDHGSRPYNRSTNDSARGRKGLPRNAKATPANPRA